LEPIKVKAQLKRITPAIYFELALFILNNNIMIPKIINVGSPFGLNEARSAPGINNRKKLLFVFSGYLIQVTKKATTSRRPDVNGMSCHSVIPIPATMGVKVKMNEVIAAGLSSKME
jgi:hypothetical protein